MTKPFPLFLCCLFTCIAYGQDTLVSQRIDSIIQNREKSLLHEHRIVIFAKEDTSIVKKGNLTRVYKYSIGNILYARIDVWISLKDTQQITYYFFDNEKLIKAGTIVPANSHSLFYEQIAYFSNGKVIHWSSSDNLPFETNYDFYLHNSRMFLKKIKHKPVRFTL